MSGGKVLLLYSDAFNESSRVMPDEKVLDTVKFLKQKLPSKLSPMELCDPSTDATGDMDIITAGHSHLEENKVCILILSK